MYHYNYRWRRLYWKPRGAPISTDEVYGALELTHPKELGWEPSLQFEEGIEKTVRWYLDNMYKNK